MLPWLLDIDLIDLYKEKSKISRIRSKKQLLLYPYSFHPSLTLYLYIVPRSESDNISESIENSLRDLHDLRAHSTVEHVDRHDGQHLRDRHRAVGEGVDEAVG